MRNVASRFLKGASAARVYISDACRRDNGLLCTARALSYSFLNFFFLPLSSRTSLCCRGPSVRDDDDDVFEEFALLFWGVQARERGGGSKKKELRARDDFLRGSWRRWVWREESEEEKRWKEGYLRSGGVYSVIREIKWCEWCIRGEGEAFCVLFSLWFGLVIGFVYRVADAFFC